MALRVGMPQALVCRAGFAVSRVSGRGLASRWPGCRGEGPEAGEDLGEQAVAGREVQGQPAGVADQPAGDADRHPAQGGDHGFVAADTVTGQDGLAAGSGGELVQPRGHVGGEQRASHPGGIDFGVARRQMAEGDAVLAVADPSLGVSHGADGRFLAFAQLRG